MTIGSGAQAQSAARSRVELNGAHWAVGEHGDGSRRLVAVHGWQNEGASWQPLLRRLGGDRYTATVVDLPGCGDSPPVDRPERSSIDVLAADLLELPQVAEGGTVLIGHSLGGAIALEMALRAPEWIDAVVAVAPAATAGMPFLDREQFEALLHPTPQATQALARAAFHRPPAAEDLELVLDAVRRAHPTHYEGALRSLRELDLRDRLGGLRLPVLVVAGDRDRHVPLREHLRTFEALGAGRLQVFHDVGHVPHWEVPDETAAVVDRFLTHVVDRAGDRARRGQPS